MKAQKLLIKGGVVTFEVVWMEMHFIDLTFHSNMRVGLADIIIMIVCYSRKHFPPTWYYVVTPLKKNTYTVRIGREKIQSSIF